MNFLRAMGNKPEKLTLSDDNEDEDDLSILKHHNRATNMSTDCATDAIYSAHSARCSFTFEPTRSNVEIICLDLENFEKVSIIFLLHDQHKEALNLMESVMEADDSTFKEWLLKISVEEKMQRKILEALCLIQNYNALKVMGFAKEQVQKMFSPTLFMHVLYIDELKRLLYKIADDMEPDQVKTLVEALNRDLKSLKYSVRQFDCLEMYIEYIFMIGYITKTNVTNLRKHFKATDCVYYADLLQKFCTEIKASTSTITLKQVCGDDIRNVGNEWSTGTNVHLTETFSHNFEDSYPMDKHNPGICLIIENETFYDEFEKDEDLVIQPNVALQQRVGTKHDSEKLIDIFGKGFGYRLHFHKNKTNEEIKNIIQKTAHEDTKTIDSSFILIILSHGIEGSIVACNKIPVTITDIQKHMNSKNLEGKPKILIIQACQGSEIQKIQTSDIELDCNEPAPAQPSRLPYTKHMVTLWSTVAGYASFRSPSSGSWFIQCLVEVLEENYQEQLADICTKVQGRIGHKEWKDGGNIKVMVPIISTTLEKKFFLPPLRPKSDRVTTSTKT